MATARFMAGPVARKMATAIGSVTPDASTGTPNLALARSIAGRQASEDWVEKAIAWLAATALVKRKGEILAPNQASGQAASHITAPTAVTMTT
jgi:hypothetical protein